MTGRGTLKALRVLALAALLSGASAAQAADGAAAVTGLADELLAHLKATSAYVRAQSGLEIGEFDPITPEAAAQEATFNKAMLARLDAVKPESLPHEEWLLARMLHQTFAT